MFFIHIYVTYLQLFNMGLIQYFEKYFQKRFCSIMYQKKYKKETLSSTKDCPFSEKCNYCQKSESHYYCGLCKQVKPGITYDLINHIHNKFINKKEEHIYFKIVNNMMKNPEYKHFIKKIIYNINKPTNRYDLLEILHPISNDVHIIGLYNRNNYNNDFIETSLNSYWCKEYTINHPCILEPVNIQKYDKGILDQNQLLKTFIILYHCKTHNKYQSKSNNNILSKNFIIHSSEEIRCINLSNMSIIKFHTFDCGVQKNYTHSLLLTMFKNYHKTFSDAYAVLKNEYLSHYQSILNIGKYISIFIKMVLGSKSTIIKIMQNINVGVLMESKQYSTYLSHFIGPNICKGIDCTFKVAKRVYIREYKMNYSMATITGSYGEIIHISFIPKTSESHSNLILCLIPTLESSLYLKTLNQIKKDSFGICISTDNSDANDNLPQKILDELINIHNNKFINIYGETIILSNLKSKLLHSQDLLHLILRVKRSKLCSKNHPDYHKFMYDFCSIMHSCNKQLYNTVLVSEKYIKLSIFLQKYDINTNEFRKIIHFICLISNDKHDREIIKKYKKQIYNCTNYDKICSFIKDSIKLYDIQLLPHIWSQFYWKTNYLLKTQELSIIFDDIEIKDHFGLFPLPISVLNAVITYFDPLKLLIVVSKGQLMLNDICYLSGCIQGLWYFYNEPKCVTNLYK